MVKCGYTLQNKGRYFMSLVPAICTQCGAQIEVDDTHEAGVCKNCGTAFITEKVINKYMTYVTNNTGANISVVSGDVENLLELARNAVELNNEDDTLKYCEKALEINVKNPDAWFIKMQGEKIRLIKAPFSDNDAKGVEAIVLAGNNCIKYEPEEEKIQRTYEVHKYFLESVASFYGVMCAKIQYENIDVLSSLAATNRAAAFMNDQEYLFNIAIRDVGLHKFITEISAIEISSNVELKELLISAINEYVEYQNAYKERTLIYSDGPNTEAAASRKRLYDQMLEMLPFEDQGKAIKWTLVGTDANTNTAPNYSNGTSGCYIATCVYGSYDCPQVWTLRRFRDYTLDKTWYGRAFIKCYYAISPTLVKWFGNQKWFRTFWKNRLDVMVNNLNSFGVEDTYYKDKY